ncbi:MAG: hypothetical protein RLZZ200_1802 [Pseudomonadota bacterium]|jgi:para-nitrobenzyl esterase
MIGNHDRPATQVRRLAVFLLSLLSWPALAARAPEVTLDSGRISGSADAVADTFLGIPYAAPPVGPLRWRAPQPVARWSGTRTAIRYGHDCMQVPFPSDAAPLGTTPAEDCLVMNVWRPHGLQAGARRPVLFWIYGGGEVNGGASPAVYSGRAFARDGVVFVSFNYRLGRFGFFGFPELSRVDADKGQLFNYGAMDVIAALRWVRENIAAFGGDPQQVTIYGQSAGAGMVSMLMGSPQSRGLFARAIIQSGGGTWSERPAPQAAVDASLAFAKRWNIDGTGAEALAKLRALSAEQIADGIHIGTRAAQAATYSGPVTDGRLYLESLRAATRAGRESKVPLLIGATSADNFDSIKAADFEGALSTAFAANPEQARAAYASEVTADPQHVVRQMGRDHRYAEPARYLARTMSAQGLPVFLYRNSYVAESMRKEWAEGPPHATDIPFAMDTLEAKYGRQLTPPDLAMAKTMHGYWVNFVRTGNPNGAGLPEWPAYDPKTDKLLSFGADGRASAMADPRRKQLDAVEMARGPSLRVGAARVDQTGPFGPAQSGKYDHERVYARAIVLDNGTVRSALISYEGPQADFDMALTRRLVAERARCPIENVLVTHTHTHSSQSAPMTFGGPVPSVPSEAILSAVDQALSRLQPARMSYGTGAAYLNVNRDAIDPDTRKWTQGTNLSGASDRSVDVLSFTGLDGHPIAVYVTYAMHPINGYVLGVVTADFPGALSRHVEKAFGDDVVVAFSQGTSGDQNPLYLRPSNNAMATRAGDPVTGYLTNREHSEGPLRLVDMKAPGADTSGKVKATADPAAIDAMFRFIESQGQILGEEVIRVMTQTRGEGRDDVRIAGYQASVTCPGRRRTNGNPLDATTREGMVGTYVDAPPVELKVGLIGLGNVALTWINTEVYTAIGTGIKARSPMNSTMIATLANERVGGYAPDDASFGHETFQVLNSSLKPGCAETGLVDAVVELENRYGNSR